MKAAVISSIAVAALASGCLAEPDPPPGHNQEYRPKADVVDLFGSGHDDLILVGHDGDPRDNAYMFVFAGGGRLTTQPTQKIPLAVADPDAVWYEPLDVTDFQHGRGTIGYELIVMTGQDPALPRDANDRKLIQTRFFIPKGGTLDPATRVTTTPVTDSFVGGYAAGLAPVFSFGRDRSDSTQGAEYAFGGAHDTWWTRATDTQPATLAATAKIPADDELLVGASVVRPNIDMSEPTLLITTKAVYRSGPMLDGPDFTFDRSVALHPTDHLARTRQLQSDSWTAIVNYDTPNVITIVDYYVLNGNSILSAFDMQTETQPTDVGFFDAGAGTVGIVTLENNLVVLYTDLMFGTGITPGTRITRELPDIDHQLLAIGQYRNANDDIYLVNTADPSDAFLCFNVVSDVFETCI